MRPRTENYLVFPLGYVFLLAGFLILSGCSLQSDYTEEMVFMGTTARITIVPDSTAARQAVTEAFALIGNFDALFSFYDADSQLGLINKRAARIPQPLSEEMFCAIKKALQYSRITNGIFDVTATSLKRKDGYRSIVLDTNKRTIFFKDKKAHIDLGGIAVGLCIDEVARLFQSLEIENFLIDIGGDIYARGKNKQGRAWSIGIRNPLAENRILERIPVTGAAISTSGNYVKRHIIDTHRGVIPESDVLSVTVIAQTCVDADVFATTFFVSGIDKTKEFLQDRKDIQAIFIINKRGTPQIMRLGSVTNSRRW